MPNSGVVVSLRTRWAHCKKWIIPCLRELNLVFGSVCISRETLSGEMKATSAPLLSNYTYVWKLLVWQASMDKLIADPQSWWKAMGPGLSLLTVGNVGPLPRVLSGPHATPRPPVRWSRRWTAAALNCEVMLSWADSFPPFAKWTGV